MECGSYVGRGVVTYPCDLEKGHAGPCRARENTLSVRERRKWEEQQAPPRPEIEVIEEPPVVEAADKAKDRPGDQPMPKPNAHPPVADAVIEDMAARKALGIRRYGVPLQPFNGRDAVRDAYEEILDAAVYLKQIAIERDHVRALLDQIEQALRSDPQDLVGALAALSEVRALAWT